uniref:Uncharacterized protein n=1 Tax=Oryza glumipatula TaxID=40148 RepID=A0A0E0ANE5_9ORYZ
MSSNTVGGGGRRGGGAQSEAVVPRSYHFSRDVELSPRARARRIVSAGLQRLRRAAATGLWRPRARPPPLLRLGLALPEHPPRPLPLQPPLRRRPRPGRRVCVLLVGARAATGK